MIIISSSDDDDDDDDDDYIKTLNTLSTLLNFPYLDFLFSFFFDCPSFLPAVGLHFYFGSFYLRILLLWLISAFYNVR